MDPSKFSQWLPRKMQRTLTAFLCTAMVVLGSSSVFAQDAQEETGDGLITPPRIGMVAGAASFWRPGAENWSAAQVNTPLAAGDSLYTAEGATLELQIGTRAYARLAQNTMLTLLSDEQDLQQIKLTSGIAAFDLRSAPGMRNIEIDTPSGAFNLDSAGYYRVEITGKGTHFIVRRGGEATVTLADGSRRLIAPSQEVVIEPGDEKGDVDTYVAPETDAWDDWNYARTDNLIDAISNRYVSPDVYGVDDLDHYGNWRVTPDYGPAWFPSGMAADWAPYSSGSWVWDPVYAWTWVDTAPWGWAPYHYGRWVNVNGYWAWAPGPRMHRPVYSPALVAFFQSGGNTVQIGLGTSAVSWVALGWGEPVRPWWGRPGFVGKPWWGGWGGPRVINNVTIQHNTVINNVTNIHYRNLDQRNAVIAIPEKNFGHGRLAGATRIDTSRTRNLTPLAGQHPIRPSAASMTPTAAVNTVVPAANVVNRPAVAVHVPQRVAPWRQEGREVAVPRTVPPTGEPTMPQKMQPLVPQSVPQSVPKMVPKTPPSGVPDNKVITVRPRSGQPSSWAGFGKTPGPERHEPRQPPEPPRADRWRSEAPANITESNRQKPWVQQQFNPPLQRQEETARVVNPPPQTPQVRRPVAAPVPPSPDGFAHQTQQAPMRAPPPDIRQTMPPREMPQEQRREQPPRGQGRNDAHDLPGRPANQLYSRPPQQTH